jgi:hypothetical protein
MSALALLEAPDGFGVSLVGAILISVVALAFAALAILTGVALLGKRGSRPPPPQ